MGMLPFPYRALALPPDPIKQGASWSSGILGHAQPRRPAQLLGEPSSSVI